MLFSLRTVIGLALAISSSAFAAPLSGRDATTPLTVTQVTGPVVEGQYIVKLKDGVNILDHIASLPFIFSPGDPSSPIKYQYSTEVFPGYAGSFSDLDLTAILASPDVELVEPNGIAHTMTPQTQNGAPWNLQSISTREPVGGNDVDSLKYTYNYHGPAGHDVDIYIIDTGINIDHCEFEGRASFGWAVPGFEKKDDNGHGTHCAGTAAGKTFGVAKHACVIAVKVFDNSGSGPWADVIAGLDWVVQHAKSTGKRSVGSMSLGGGASDSVDTAVRNAIAAGIPIAVAAGNSNMDASLFSPARVQEAITVAASDIKNRKASFSNYGLPVDIFAPGVDIISSYIGSSDATAVLSGSSMATPHIAGLCAYILSTNPTISPAALQDKIKAMGTSGVLTGIPPLTPNLLAYNGGTDGVSDTPGSSSGSNVVGTTISRTANTLKNAFKGVSNLAGKN